MVFKKRLNQQEIIEVAKEYKKKLEEKYPVEALYLFGSYSRGRPHDWSDIDFLVVSSAFGKESTFDDLVETNILANRVSPMIEAHPASVREFEEADSPWIAEAKRYGKKVG